jgi:hypothetical protein
MACNAEKVIVIAQASNTVHAQCLASIGAIEIARFRFCLISAVLSHGLTV